LLNKNTQYYYVRGRFILFIGIFVMILKKKSDGKGKMVLNGKNYWTHYRKMPNVLCLTKLVKVMQINVPETGCHPAYKRLQIH